MPREILDHEVYMPNAGLLDDGGRFTSQYFLANYEHSLEFVASQSITEFHATTGYVIVDRER